MRLLRLHIHGFKSFKDKTIINFDDGITGIVGPNGCGKSNIVDALFWVMGEQSAKHLRGKAMSDLIFAGSSKYAPGSFAEVTLVLANDTGKHIHVNNQVIKPDEIHLTRKLYRNGETEYRINGTPARLKDIQEVFMDTGAGAKSYSIIAQGEINKLVQAKPEERRVMIEEVAGITKFKIRKKDSLKKIELTQSNLNRLTDLQAEIYKNLKALEKQAEKAEKARTLRDRIKRNELVVDSHRELELLTEFKENSIRFEAESQEVEQLQMKRNQLEVTLADERIRKDDLMSEVNDHQEEFNLLSKKLAQGEERLTYLKKSLKEKEHQISLRTKESSEIRQDMESRKERLLKWEEELEVLKNTNPESLDLSDREEKVSLLKQELSDREQELHEKRQEVDKLQRDLQNLEHQMFQNQRRLEDYSQSLQDINTEADALEQSTSTFSDELTGQREKLATAKKTYEESKAQNDKLKASLEEINQEIKSLDHEVRLKSKDVVKLESRKQSLIELNEAAQGAEAGMREFLSKETNQENFALMGKVLQSDPQYGEALERLLGQYFSSLIGQTADQNVLGEWLETNQEKALNYILPVRETTFTSKTDLEAIVGPLIAVEDVIRFTEDRWTQTYSSLFKGFYLATESSAQKLISLDSSFEFKGIISVDGRFAVRNEQGIVTVQNFGDFKAVGIVQRNNQIAELDCQWQESRAQLELDEKFLSQLNDRSNSIREEMKEFEASYDSAYTQFIALKSALESREGTFNAGASRLEILKSRKSDISRQRLELIEREEQLALEKEKFAPRIAELEAEQEELAETVFNLKAQYEQEKEELLRLQVMAKSYESQLKNIQHQIDDTHQQIERYQQKMVANDELLEKYAEEMDLAEAEIEQLTDDNKNKASELAEREEGLNLIKDQLSQLLVGMQDRETQVKEMSSRINKLEKSLVEVEMKVKKVLEDEELLVRNTFEQHRVNLRAVLAKHLEMISEVTNRLTNLDSMFVMETADGAQVIEVVPYEFQKKFPGELKEAREKLKEYKQEFNRLGEINWQAVEDYDRQKMRHDFLKVQEEELKTSLADLQKAIEHIDLKCRVRFKEAYDAVNVRFTKVFPIIFGGGSASLDLTGDIDDTECGIEIIAQPPGKKMQNINLMSGGEKAMTAVSLIFSIFLVKPSPFCLLDEVDAPLDDANVGRFNELLREMSSDSQFIVITHNKKTMELNDVLYGITMQEPGVSRAVSVQLH